eukprot:7259870-Prymnesium_polylepis.1
MTRIALACVGRARRLDDAVKGVLVARGGVDLDDLLDLVGALRELDLRLHVALVRLEQHLHAVHVRAKRVGRDAATLHLLGRHVGEGLVRLRQAGVGDICVEGKLHRARVVHGHRLRVDRRLDDRVNRPEAAVLGVDAELGRDVRRRLPQLDVGVERTATLAPDRQLHTRCRLLADVPRLQR